MAGTDTISWLNNKLGSTDDLWSGNSICSQLSKERLLSITDCFHTLQAHVKVKLLLAILHVSKRNIEEWKDELEDLYRVACNDSDMWVSTIADILKTFPSTGFLNSDVKESQAIFHEVISDLKKLVKRHQETRMYPLECSCLSRTAMQALVGLHPPPTKHFALKRKPKSATLRVELLQKSSDAANNLKRNASSVPVKMRSFAKKIDNDAPLKGIQQHQGHSGFISKNNSIMGRFSGANKRESISQKEGGIKLIEFDALPLSAKEAKKKRKLEIEKEKAAKKEESLTSPPPPSTILTSPPLPSTTDPTISPSTTMPDYAAGLLPATVTFENNLENTTNNNNNNEDNNNNNNNIFNRTQTQDFFTSQIILPSPNNNNNNNNLNNTLNFTNNNLNNINTNTINFNNNTLLNLCNNNNNNNVINIGSNNNNNVINIGSNNNNNVINIGSNNNNNQAQTIRFTLLPASLGQHQMTGPIYITQRQQQQQQQQQQPLVLTTHTLNNRPTLVLQQPQQQQQTVAVANNNNNINSNNNNNNNFNNNSNNNNPLIIKASPLINPSNIIRLSSNQSNLLSSLKNIVPCIRLVQPSQTQPQTVPLNLQRQQSNNNNNQFAQQQQQQQQNQQQLQQLQQSLQQSLLNQQQQQQQQQQQPTNIEQEKKILSVPVMEVSKLFQTYRDITQSEKLLIISFLSGSRVNPYPEQGPILNIRLCKSDESMQQPNGLFKPMLVETFLQLNYNTGEYKTVKKIREADNE